MKTWISVVVFGFLTLTACQKKPQVETELRAKEKVMVTLETSLGNIVIELNPEKAPLTAANFLEYVKSGFYDGTIFHRVINGFMIQGGGFDVSMNQKEVRAPVKNESVGGLANDEMTISMARTSSPDSATAQFFINLGNNSNLNAMGSTAGYTVFGKVVQGQDVVKQIAKVKVANYGPHQNVPKDSVVIKKVTAQ